MAGVIKRRVSNGEQVHMISGLAMKRGAVRRFLRILPATCYRLKQEAPPRLVIAGGRARPY